MSITGVVRAEMIYAGFVPRALAQLVDLLVLTPLMVLHLAIFHGFSFSVAIASFLALGVIGQAYPLYFHARWGQTVGKMAAKIRVVRLDGRPLGPQRALARSSVDILIWVAFALSMIFSMTGWSTPDWHTMSWTEHGRFLPQHVPFYRLWKGTSAAWTWSELAVLLLNSKRRSLHDFIAGTVVIRIPGQNSRPAPAPSATRT